MHYGIRADIFKKSYQEMFNFEIWFLCQFSSNTWIFLLEGLLTPQKLENEKIKLQIPISEGIKLRNCKGLFRHFKYVLDIIYLDVYFKFNQNIFQIFAQKSWLERKCLGWPDKQAQFLDKATKKALRRSRMSTFTDSLTSSSTASSYIIEMRWSFEDICMFT